MANIVSISDFVYPYTIDTSNQSTVEIITQIINHVEGVLVEQVNTDDEDLVKEMILCFVYSIYCSETLRHNSPIGNLNVNSEYGIKELDLSKPISIYNNGIDIFNTIKKYDIQKMNYINDFGI